MGNSPVIINFETLAWSSSWTFELCEHGVRSKTHMQQICLHDNTKNVYEQIL